MKLFSSVYVPAFVRLSSAIAASRSYMSVYLAPLIFISGISTNRAVPRHIAFIDKYFTVKGLQVFWRGAKARGRVSDYCAFWPNVPNGIYLISEAISHAMFRIANCVKAPPPRPGPLRISISCISAQYCTRYPAAPPHAYC